jgi:hypothetical protein
MTADSSISTIAATAVADDFKTQSTTVDYEMAACYCGDADVFYPPETPVLATSGLRL